MRLFEESDFGGGGGGANGYYILHGKTPVPEPNLLRWGKWMEEAKRHVGKYTYQRHGYRLWVSTVFLGLDHSFFQGPPLLFETGLFLIDGPGLNDIYMTRYSTWDEAEAGHWVCVEMARTVTRRQLKRGWD